MPKTTPDEYTEAAASAIRHARATVGDVAAFLKNRVEPEIWLRIESAKASGLTPPKLRVVFENGELKILDVGPGAAGHHDHAAKRMLDDHNAGNAS